MFAAPKSDERSFPTVPVAIAAAVVLVVIAAALLIGRHDGADAAKLKTLQPPAAYADNLPVSGVQMSEATSYSGAKVLYLDGHLANTGNATVNDVTVQVIFGNIVGEAPKVETTPLMLIRAREPYVDVEPVSAGPIAPGTSAWTRTGTSSCRRCAWCASVRSERKRSYLATTS
jgi:hypothetical protein